MDSMHISVHFALIFEETVVNLFIPKSQYLISFENNNITKLSLYWIDANYRYSNVQTQGLAMENTHAHLHQAMILSFIFNLKKLRLRFCWLIIITPSCSAPVLQNITAMIIITNYSCHAGLYKNSTCHLFVKMFYFIYLNVWDNTSYFNTCLFAPIL